MNSRRSRQERRANVERGGERESERERERGREKAQTGKEREKMRGRERERMTFTRESEDDVYEADRTDGCLEAESELGLGLERESSACTGSLNSR